MGSTCTMTLAACSGRPMRKVMLIMNICSRHPGAPVSTLTGRSQRRSVNPHMAMRGRVGAAMAIFWHGNSSGTSKLQSSCLHAVERCLPLS